MPWKVKKIKEPAERKIGGEKRGAPSGKMIVSSEDLDKWKDESI